MEAGKSPVRDHPAEKCWKNWKKVQKALPKLFTLPCPYCNRIVLRSTDSMSFHMMRKVWKFHLYACQECIVIS
jgi:hypothetical protein